MDLICLGLQIIVFFTVTISVYCICFLMEQWYKRYLIFKRVSLTSKKIPKNKIEKIKKVLKKFLYFLGGIALPKQKGEIVSIKKQLSYAGYRDEIAITTFFGIKIFLGILFSFIYLIITIISDIIGIHIFYIFLFTAIGYYLPGWFLKYKVKLRQNQIFKELPEVIDLLLICMEAGLSFDMAFLKVTRELSSIAPVLSKEFSQYFFEIKSGLPRTEVLKNLAERNGEKNLNSVVQVLLQSFRFGTDIASSLRVYSESLRNERIQIAKEKSARLSIKLTFITILLILPAYLLIVMGPTIVRIKNVFLR